MLSGNAYSSQERAREVKVSTVRLTVGQAIITFLSVQFSERDGLKQRLVPGMWAILGHGNVAGLGQALQELGSSLDLPGYRPQNEQAMVHAAAAFAKHRDRLATFACTASIGPGSLNMLTAAAGATINRLPVLLLPSDYFANRVPDPVLQQLEQPGQFDVTVNDAFRPVSRFYARIDRPEQLIPALLEAMRVLTDPVETGAVTLSLPEDVQAEAFDWPAALFEERVWHVRRPEPEAVMLQQAVALLQGARRPLIIAGGGVTYSGAGELLAEFAGRHSIPVVETQAGKGALPWNHPLNAGPVGVNGGSAANELARSADVVLAIGTRLGDFVTGSRSAFQQQGVRFIGLNVAPFDAHKLVGLPLIADARRGLEALQLALPDDWQAGAEGYRQEISGLKAQWDATVTDLRTVKDPGNLAQSEIIGLVNDSFGGEATVICAAGSMPGDLLKLWRPVDPKAYHVEYGFSCMGYEIPAGLGVRLAEPDREVVVFIGDGSYLMLNSELVTAVAEGIRFTVILVDNHGYQSIHGLQRASGTPGFLNELRSRNPVTGQLDGPWLPVDFVAHAQALGAQALFAAGEQALRGALTRAAEADRVTVIVVPADPEKRMPGFSGWWDVPIAQESSQPGVTAAREAYAEGRAKQRDHL
jgi:3D-(3,5/4)-trihydroxycyclohexane-1,2-dione acylhydrolase (decyclizing)